MIYGQFGLKRQEFFVVFQKSSTESQQFLENIWINILYSLFLKFILGLNFLEFHLCLFNISKESWWTFIHKTFWWQTAWHHWLTITQYSLMQQGLTHSNLPIFNTFYHRHVRNNNYYTNVAEKCFVLNIHDTDDYDDENKKVW